MKESIKYRFIATLSDGQIVRPKGFYYQGSKHIVLVGDEDENHTIRQKFLVEDVLIEVIEI